MRTVNVSTLWLRHQLRNVEAHRTITPMLLHFLFYKLETRDIDNSCDSDLATLHHKEVAFRRPVFFLFLFLAEASVLLPCAASQKRLIYFYALLLYLFFKCRWKLLPDTYIYSRRICRIYKFGFCALHYVTHWRRGKKLQLFVFGRSFQGLFQVLNKLLGISGTRHQMPTTIIKGDKRGRCARNTLCVVDIR